MKAGNGSWCAVESLEPRQLFAISFPGLYSHRHAHHLHHVHTLHHQAHLHRMHIHRAHLHHLHTRHALHAAHVRRTTVPAPIVLTAQQRSNWVGIRDVFSQKRVHI